MKNLLHLAVIIWLAGLGVKAGAQCTPPPPGLSFWVTADNTAVDQIGDLCASAGTPVFVPGEVNQAFQFDGSSTLVYPTNTLWDFNNGNFTIELWVNYGSTAGNQALVACDQGGGCNVKWMFGWGILGNPSLGFYCDNGGASYNIGAGSWVPTAGVWYHIAATRNGNTFTFYVNGSPIGATSYGGNMPAVSTYPLDLGSSGFSEGFLFTGSLDEICIYHGTALTDAQIAAQYAAGSSGKCRPPAFWLVPTNTTAALGSTVTFDTVVNCAQSYQWYFNGSALSDGGQISGSASTNLTITGITSANAGAYCEVAQGDGYSVTNLVVQLNNYQPLPLPAGCVGWWPGNGNGNDLSGNANSATLVGGAGYGPGEVGQSFAFPAGSSGNSVEVVTNLAAYNIGTNNFTIELWVNFSGAAANQVFVSQDQGGGYKNKWYFGCQNYGNPGLGFYCENGGGGYNIGVDSWRPIIGVWYHIAATYDVTNHLYSFYANGILVGWAVSGDLLPVLTYPLVFGNAENSDPFSGALDEISLYTNCLSPAQIGAIYEAAGSGKTPAAPAPTTFNPAPWLMLGN